MQYDIAASTAFQPFLKLAQANMESFGKFGLSPEMTAEAMRTMRTWMEQASASAVTLGQSRALAELTQDLMRNYTEFVTDLSQSAYAVMGQAQASMLQQTQDAATNVIDAATARAARRR